MTTETPASLPEVVQPAAKPSPRRWLMRLLMGLLSMALLFCTLWASAALFFDVRITWLRVPLACAYLLGVLALAIFEKKPWAKLGWTAGAFVLVLLWWFNLQPSNNRNWQPDLARLAYADVIGNKVLLHNIRNCDYRTETDFDVNYYDKSFDLGKIRSVDLYMVYWGSPHMAHTMVSFGFPGDNYVCFSIETRKEKGEGYSAVKGLFRQFELIYVAADERDLVRLRTNYREGEEVYVFRLKASQANLREFFLNYIQRLNQLREQPEWYNAVNQNCTTSIRAQRAASERAPWDWRMLANGHGDELLYERGAIVNTMPLAKLKQEVHINTRAKAADKSADFSRLIREGVPGME